MPDPTLKELLFRLDDQNRVDHQSIVDNMNDLKQEFTIFKWKIIGLATGGATVLSSLIMLAVKVIF